MDVNASVLNDFRFKESDYYVMKDGKIYRHPVAGLYEEKWHITRKVGDYKIHAENFPDCALPYTNYYVIDTKEQKIYESRDHIYSKLNDLVAALKALEQG